MHKTSRLKLTDINPHLQCVLCGGYIIEATAIIECLHSFCRSCITKYLEGSKCCPICDVQVHKTRPLLNLRPDKTLQTLVYKLVPGLYKKEMLRRREFYKARPDAAPSLSSPNVCEERGEVDSERYDVKEKPENISLVLQHCDRLPLPSNDVHGKQWSVTEKSQTNGDRRYLLCPAAVTVSHLKKFLRSKFDIRLDYQIELFYHGDETLPEDYTLADVAYVYGWTRTEQLRIFYVVLDTREVCLRLPTPATSAPIILNHKRESQPKEPAEPAKEPESLPESQRDPAEDHVLSEDEVRPSTPPKLFEDADSEEEALPTAVEEVTEPVVIAERVTKQHSHKHKKKKKKKKHKRSKSKELTEEQRSVIKVRIPKDKICQSVFTGSLGLVTPEDSHDEDYARSPTVPTPPRHFKRLYSFTDDSEAESQSTGFKPPRKSRDVSKVICMGRKRTSELDIASKFQVDERDNVSLDASVCSSLNEDSKVTDTVLDKEPESPGATNDTTYGEDMSFFTDSEQDSSFENSQVSQREYTCEISRDGKVLLHSAKSRDGNRKLLPSMDIVIEETPPQVIVVDKDVEIPNNTLADIGLTEPFGKSDKSEKVDTQEKSTTLDICPTKLLNTSNGSVIIEDDIESEPSVLVEVDESGTLREPVDNVSPKKSLEDVTPEKTQDGAFPKKSLDEVSSKVSLDNSQQVIAPGSVSPSDGACSPNEPMKSARTDAHYQTSKVKDVEPARVPFGVHSSLSPPNGKPMLKRTSPTDSGPCNKHPKISEKQETDCTITSESLTVSSNLQSQPSTSAKDLSAPNAKPRASVGVHSSLSPPAGSTSKVKPERRVASGVDAHGFTEFKRMQYTSAIPTTTPFQAYRQALQMTVRNESSSSSRKTGSGRGPLKERPVTLPVSHATIAVKPSIPTPKPPTYGPVPTYPLYQPHIHPSLSAISAIAAQVHTQHHLAQPMKNLRLMCSDMPSPLLTPHSMPQGYHLQAPGFLPSSRHFLSPIFSPPLPARSLPSPLSPTRASPLSPNHFAPLSPAHFSAMSPPRHSPPRVTATHLNVPGYDAPLELTTRKYDVPLELTTVKRPHGTATATVTSDKR